MLALASFVVYFDQQTGASYAVHWSKSASSILRYFHSFFHKREEKTKKQKKVKNKNFKGLLVFRRYIHEEKYTKLLKVYTYLHLNHANSSANKIQDLYFSPFCYAFSNFFLILDKKYVENAKKLILIASGVWSTSLLVKIHNTNNCSQVYLYNRYCWNSILLNSFKPKIKTGPTRREIFLKFWGN